LTKQTKADIAASFQQAAIDVLNKKIIKTINQTGRENIIIAGGVAANKKLRSSIKELELKVGVNVYYPDLKYCGDNGAMISFLGALRSGTKANSLSSNVRARWPLTDELSK